jgi:putative aminopeptidase FrvX
MNRDAILKIVQPLLECPTAPMFENAVRKEIKRQLSDIEGLKLQVDSHGNLIAWCGRGLCPR